MRHIRINFSSILRPVRFLVAVCICTFLVFSYAFPAYSDPVNITGEQSAPQEGEAQLRGIERQAQEATQERPYSREETQSKARPGLNEIQGSADVEQMKRPENTPSEAISVEDKSKNFLDAIIGKKD